MKHVFKTEELAHIWAQQKQDSGKNPQGNFYFSGQTIFSYGGHFPIASFVAPGVVLMTTRGYSNTTSKHIYQVRDAIRHLKVFEGREVPITEMLNSHIHDGNIEDFIKAFPLQQKAAIKSRKYGEQERAKLSADIRKAVEYAAYFKKAISKKNKAELKKWADKEKAGKLFNDKELAKIKAVVKEETAAAKVLNAEHRAKQAADAAERARTLEENLQVWLNGGTVNSYRLPTDSVRLRVVGDEIQTTRGASIPLIAARKLWRRFLKNTVSPELTGLNLGNYTVDSVEVTDNTTATETAGMLVVGCHRIPFSELYRIADVLGWRDGVPFDVSEVLK